LLIGAAGCGGTAGWDGAAGCGPVLAAPDGVALAEDVGVFFGAFLSNTELRMGDVCLRFFGATKSTTASSFLTFFGADIPAILYSASVKPVDFEPGGGAAPFPTTAGAAGDGLGAAGFVTIFGAVPFNVIFGAEGVDAERPGVGGVLPAVTPEIDDFGAAF
jgi:hypothetical protein